MISHSETLPSKVSLYEQQRQGYNEDKQGAPDNLKMKNTNHPAQVHGRWKWGTEHHLKVTTSTATEGQTDMTSNEPRMVGEV